MAHPHQPYWLWAGSISATASVALVTVAATLDAGRAHLSFWTSDLTICAYFTTLVAIACFVCAIREARFPFASNRNREADIDPAANGRSLNGGGQHPSASRVFVESTPKDLVALFKTRTSAQAQRVLEPLYGQWMRLHGTVGDVGEWTDSGSEVVFQSPPRDPYVSMMFKDKNVFDNSLSVLKAGVRITIVGQIERIDAAGIQITNCEIESIGRLRRFGLDAGYRQQQHHQAAALI